MSIFERYAPFVQDFIYRNNWENLRAIQVAAGDAIFNTDENVLLSASTASGKTEAAFFPILTLFWEDMPRSVGAIYIGPLKALINDQFMRLNDLCIEAEVPVWHWHGDVSQSHKNRLLKNPSGILQITPESLEALLLHKHASISQLFGDLRFVVIDEVHSLMRGDRGGQTLCLIERLSRLAGVNPRRIGLSATIGDLESTGRFLASGTGKGTVIPKIEMKGTKWRLSMEHFFISGPQAGGITETAEQTDGTEDTGQVPGAVDTERTAGTENTAQANAAYDTEKTDKPAAESTEGAARASLRASGFAHTAAWLAGSSGGRILPPEPARTSGNPPQTTLPVSSADPSQEYAETSLPPQTEISDTAPRDADPGIGYIFEHTRGKKCLVFVNSREECEAVTTTLRQYCELKHEPDRFLIHHGNLSASYRETAEDIMRDEEQYQTTVTTATLELGIDIGRLERAFQIDAPFTVSSFLQRMGRTGRRDLPPEMWFVMREEQPEARAMLPATIPWPLLQGIALIQLYMEDRWVEPPKLDRLPFSLLYHQTMSTLASCGEMTPAALASRVLSLSYFHRITQEDYRLMLNHLIGTGHIERVQGGGLIVGLAGERVTNSFRFYAVFQENEEYTVRTHSEELGTIVKPPPIGEKIALAGHVWVVQEVDHKRHLVYCEPVKGKVPAYFGQCPGDVHTKILERMHQVLQEERSYPYLMKNGAARLMETRRTAFNADLANNPLVCLGGNMWCLFPWLGSYAFLAMERFLMLRCAPQLELNGLDSSRPYFIQFKMKATKEEFFRVLFEQEKQPLDPMELIYPKEEPLFEKYDEFLPIELIRKGFAYGILDIEKMKERIRSWERNLTLQTR